jgi:hypothetical protein
VGLKCYEAREGTTGKSYTSQFMALIKCWEKKACVVTSNNENNLWDKALQSCNLSFGTTLS